VDDDHVFRVSLRDFLMENGYAVFMAMDGGKALSLAGKLGSQLNLAVVDLTLPVVGGYEVISALRRRDGSLNILAVSETLNEYHLEVALRLGACSAIRKPAAGGEAEWYTLLRCHL
jgi:DNA-binding response OmpR family regulator